MKITQRLDGSKPHSNRRRAGIEEIQQNQGVVPSIDRTQAYWLGIEHRRFPVNANVSYHFDLIN
jgi:hypothetical protein